MSPITKILIVEHDIYDIELVQRELKKGGINFESEIVETEHDYGNALKNFIPDIILSDYKLPSFNGAIAFEMRERIAPETPIIFVSGTIGEENSIEFIKNGLTDFALKDRLFTLPIKVKRALKEAKEKQQKNKTEQKRIESEKRLARAQQIAHMGSWELNFATNVVMCSDEACRIYGLSPGQNLQSLQTWLSFIHPEDLDLVSEKVKESQKSLSNFSLYHRLVHKNRFVRHVYSESKLEFDSNGEPVCMYGIVHDVTEIKLAETERIKMVNDLIQRNEDLEQFTYIVSHNLRAPVANILGAASGLNYSGLSAERKDMLWHGIAESITRLDHVVRDLNHILQVKQEINATKEKIRFSELVNDIKTSIKNLIGSNEVEIKYDFSEMDEFLTLKSYLYSIFYNLISNSIKYRQPQVPCIIEIESHRLVDKIELIFTDNGMGIDLQKRSGQVFGLYRRFHKNIAGKGMGLFMVKKQVETLGGKISVKSQVNKGTEFKIEFDI